MKYFLCLIVAFVAAVTARAQQPALQISRLTGDFYVFTTYRDIEGGPYPANGLYVVTKEGVIMIDMPWDTTQTVPLLDTIRARHGKEVIMSISTHFHDDRTAAINILNRHGVHTFSSAQTKELCRLEKNPEATYTFSHDTSFTISGVTVQAFYPGAGHTKDNIVVWFPAARVLYGGCFIKSKETNSIGNLSHADTKAWPASLHQLMRACPGVRYVVPGHQAWGNASLLRHTLHIVNTYNKGKH